ncbi:MAG: 2-oxo-4-hydroxy-4-carboxy-5-ureidoimidazoline decarboxylase, partial [Betaproteobacteria bacterium]
MEERALVAALGAIYERSPWVATCVAAARPFASVEALAAGMAAAVASAGDAQQLALIRAH